MCNFGKELKSLIESFFIYTADTLRENSKGVFVVKEGA
jgi:hypothetical protein